MKKSKRLEIVSTIVKKHKIYKKEQIISYIEEYFGVRYSATTIAVKSRLLCKMLYNVFTISTYQN
ncbi:hypothetical protein GZ145_13970 [Staphylococcus aureus]|nr:hypothetical protein [Staphylococcus aureus]